MAQGGKRPVEVSGGPGWERGTGRWPPASPCPRAHVLLSYGYARDEVILLPWGWQAMGLAGYGAGYVSHPLSLLSPQTMSPRTLRRSQCGARSTWRGTAWS